MVTSVRRIASLPSVCELCEMIEYFLEMFVFGAPPLIGLCGVLLTLPAVQVQGVTRRLEELLKEKQQELSALEAQIISKMDQLSTETADLT